MVKKKGKSFKNGNNGNPKRVMSGGAPTSVTVARSMSLFPDKYECWSRSKINTVLAGVTGPTYHTYHLNSPCYLFGPQVNNTGAFAANVPAGVIYLLSSSAGSGAAAPYAAYLAPYIEIAFEGINMTNADGVYATIVISKAPSLAGSTNTQLAEERWSKQILLPPIMSAQSVKMSTRFALDEFYGVSREQVNNNPSFKGVAGAYPSINDCYCHIVLQNASGAGTTTMDFSVKFEFKMIFSELNHFTDLTPV